MADSRSAAPDSRPAAAGPGAGAVRYFGRRQLLRLLGKSDRSMAWLALERDGSEQMLVLPRQMPRGNGAVEHWLASARRAARLAHPQLAAVVEVGTQEGWPFVAHEMKGRATLVDKLGKKGLPGADAAALAIHALRGLAYAHEAGCAHHDLQPWLLLLDDQGQVAVAGLAVAPPVDLAEDNANGGYDSATLQWQRRTAERDVLSLGLVLHGLLAGTPALDEPDIGRAMLRLAPPVIPGQAAATGPREIVRLPWSGPHPVPDPLRAIVNRATDRQERQRYRNARTLMTALEGWLRAESAAGGGVLALLGDRLRAAGVLPSAPGAAQRAARLALMEQQRTDELAEVVLEDLAQAFELLRAVNTAQVRGAQVSGSGPVLTVRRAIAMLGLEGVRRAALSLRPWPGPLNEAAAAELERLIERCKRAGRVAMALRPPGYDREVIYLVTLLQNLGRLVVHYHFPDEAVQIRRLTLPAPAAKAGEPDEPGMPEDSAAFAVLGVDIEALGQAVARWWGLDESVLAMTRRLPPAGPVRAPETDDDYLRLVASCANEAVEAASLPAPAVTAALQRVVQRYARALDIGLQDIRDALQGVREERVAQTDFTPIEPAAEPKAEAKAGSLRASASRVAP